MQMYMYSNCFNLKSEVTLSESSVDSHQIPDGHLIRVSTVFNEACTSSVLI